MENAACFLSHIVEKPITTASQRTLTASGAQWTKTMISINDLDFVVREHFLFRTMRVNVFVYRRQEIVSISKKMNKITQAVPYFPVQ